MKIIKLVKSTEDFYIQAMITEKQQAFLEARTVLPSPHSTRLDVIVIATGDEPAFWTPHYIYTPGQQRYFTFIRESQRNCWVCSDKQLQDWLETSNILALRSLEEVQMPK